MSRRTAHAAMLVASTAALVLSCGAPKSSEVRTIDERDVPPELFVTTSPPTTTTTIPSTTPPSVDITVAPSTTEPAPTEPVSLYFIDGDRLVQVTIERPVGVSERQVLRFLETGPPPEAGPGLRSAVPIDAIDGVEVVEGVAVIELNPSVDEIPDDDQLFAIGQIVLSMKRPGVGQVRFTRGGKPKPVPLGDTRDSGRRELLFEDYIRLLEPPDTQPPSTDQPIESDPSSTKPAKPKPKPTKPPKTTTTSAPATDP